MECISVFDMLKIGVGPSSSHTLGPWRASQKWIQELKDNDQFNQVKSVAVELYGSLSLTGIGHATDKAVILGLSGTDPETIPVDSIDDLIQAVTDSGELQFGGDRSIKFNVIEHLLFKKSFLDFHSNGMMFRALLENGTHLSETYYSIGGGFVVKDGQEQEESEDHDHGKLPFPIGTGVELIEHCSREGKTISQIVMQNELTWRSEEEVKFEIDRVWKTMFECMYIGCHTEGILPGGLDVERRAFGLNEKLMNGLEYADMNSWFESIRKFNNPFHKVIKWISCFALSINEVNASLGRVVTAPTNGSAGVIPAVLMYYLCFVNKFAGQKEIERFLLTAGEIGSIIKKGATISAAMGGCQAEIGVSSAMAAGALTDLLGGSPDHVLMAAEIAMEHHLGLTCDPIGGLVQIPCIERNSMGAIKAINAAEMAMERDPEKAKINLDMAVETMWQTAQDMNSKYKETSEGGLALSVNISAC
jgi:L-serine dehydratase